MNIFTNKRFSWQDIQTTLPEGFNAKDVPVFNVSFPVSNNWDDMEQRLLIVCEHVDTNDLKAKALCSEYYGTVLSNLLEQAIKFANLAMDVGRVRDYGIACVPFPSFKSYHLDAKRQTIANRHFAKRVEKMMSVLKPTHVIVLGDTAAKEILDLENYKDKRGWCHLFSRPWGKFAGLSTIDPADLISVTSSASLDAALEEDDDFEDDSDGGRDLFSKTNLLGQVFRDMSNIFTYGNTPEDEHGLLWSVANVHRRATHRLIRTMKNVDRLFDMLMEADRIAYDTECRSLNRIDNKLLTMQFSMDEKTSFILPYRHRDSPFNNKRDLAYIRDRAYELFCNTDIDPFGDRYLIGTNLQFDLIQTRQQLQIPIITWPCYDIQSGDFMFDENTAELDNYKGNGNAAWSLAAICTRFGSEAYLAKEGFNKADRANMEATSLDDKSVIEYMGLDCFDLDTLVLTSRGSMLIKDIIELENESRPQIVSFNHETGESELKNILAVSTHTTSKEMYEIEYEGGLLRVTEDHKLWSVTRQQYVRAMDLTEGEELLLYRPS